MLANKKILFISSKFFGYELEIMNAMIKNGAEVDFYDDRPKNTFWIKALIRVNKNLLKKSIEDYYDKIINNIKTKEYDFILFLKAESISVSSLKKLKSTQNGVLILYLWDSIRNRNDIIPLLKYFDKVFSFDKSDVEEFHFMEFRPLFFSERYERISSKKPTVDLCFIGTAHSDRFKIINEIKKLCKGYGLKVFSFIYLQSKIMYYYLKYFSNSINGSNPSDFKYEPMTQEEVVEKISNAKVVLDIQHSKQEGLTMRTFEILGAKKKLITTNREITCYDFYNQNNIQVISRAEPFIEKEFFETPFVEVNERILERYRLKNWLEDIFN